MCIFNEHIKYYRCKRGKLYQPISRIRHITRTAHSHTDWPSKNITHNRRLFAQKPVISKLSCNSYSTAITVWQYRVKEKSTLIGCLYCGAPKVRFWCWWQWYRLRSCVLLSCVLLSRRAKNSSLNCFINALSLRSSFRSVTNQSAVECIIIARCGFAARTGGSRPSPTNSNLSIQSSINPVFSRHIAY